MSDPKVDAAREAEGAEELDASDRPKSFGEAVMKSLERGWNEEEYLARKHKRWRENREEWERANLPNPDRW